MRTAYSDVYVTHLRLRAHALCLLHERQAASDSSRVSDGFVVVSGWHCPQERIQDPYRRRNGKSRPYPIVLVGDGRAGKGSAIDEGSFLAMVERNPHQAF